MMSKMEARGNRRSARILALEEKAHALFLQKAESKTTSEGSSNVAASLAATKNRKRGRKRKSLHDVHLGAFLREPKLTAHDDTSIKHGGPIVEANWSSNQLMPNKEALEFILDVLQRKDGQELFAQPVDPTEVAGYYDIIREPMDFGTMRAKLQEGMYKSLEQFERDANLVFSNAMRFNSPKSVYYTVAEDLSILGQRLFSSLRTEPRNFDYIYTRTRQQLSNKASGEAGGPLMNLVKSSTARGSASLNDWATNRTDQRYFSPWHPKPYINQRTSKVAAGPRDGSSFLSDETERRKTYMSEISRLNREKPIISAVYNSPKFLTDASGGAMQYVKSLNRFVEDLGPTAKAVADKKLGKPPVGGPSCMSWNPAFSSKPANYMEPAAAYSVNGVSATGKPNFNGGQMPFSYAASSSNLLKGKMLCADGSACTKSDNILLGDKLGVCCGGELFSSRDVDIIGTRAGEKSSGKSDSSMDLLIATIMQLGAMQSHGGSLCVHPPSPMMRPLSRSSKPVVTSNGAGKSHQFTTFLRGAEPRHRTSNNAAGAGAAYMIPADQRLNAKSAHPLDWGQLSSWATTRGAASEGQQNYNKWVAPQNVGSGRGMSLFQKEFMSQGANSGRSQQQQGKPWSMMMTNDAASSSSSYPPTTAALRMANQQPDLSLQL